MVAADDGQGVVVIRVGKGGDLQQYAVAVGVEADGIARGGGGGSGGEGIDIERAGRVAAAAAQRHGVRRADSAADQNCRGVVGGARGDCDIADDFYGHQNRRRREAESGAGLFRLNEKHHLPVYDLAFFKRRSERENMSVVAG